MIRDSKVVNEYPYNNPTEHPAKRGSLSPYPRGNYDVMAPDSSSQNSNGSAITMRKGVNAKKDRSSAQTVKH